MLLGVRRSIRDRWVSAFVMVSKPFGRVLPIHASNILPVHACFATECLCLASSVVDGIPCFFCQRKIILLIAVLVNSSSINVISHLFWLVLGVYQQFIVVEWTVRVINFEIRDLNNFLLPLWTKVISILSPWGNYFHWICCTTVDSDCWWVPFEVRFSIDPVSLEMYIQCEYKYSWFQRLNQISSVVKGLSLWVNREFVCIWTFNSILCYWTISLIWSTETFKINRSCLSCRRCIDSFC